MAKKLPGFNYRRRIVVHLDLEGKVGFYQAASGTVIDITHCLISSEIINRGLTELRLKAQKLAPLVASVVIEENESDFFLVFKARESISRDEVDNLRKLCKSFRSYEARQGKKVFAFPPSKINRQ